jgi:hypothetical protein
VRLPWYCLLSGVSACCPDRHIKCSNDIDASLKQFGTRPLRGLFALRHEVLRELAEAKHERIPGALCRQEQHAGADLFDEDIIAFETEFGRQPDSLAAAATE